VLPGREASGQRLGVKTFGRKHTALSSSP
jgi:hypothetical protein